MSTYDPRQVYYDQREIYEAHLKLLQNEEAVLRAAELKMHEKCFELAIEYGVKKGIEQGIEEGRLQQKRQLVINMLDNNIPIAVIAECTGLSIEKIEEIKKTYKYN